jgi:hypothetical protein
MRADISAIRASDSEGAASLGSVVEGIIDTLAATSSLALMRHDSWFERVPVPLGIECQPECAVWKRRTATPPDSDSGSFLDEGTAAAAATGSLNDASAPGRCSFKFMPGSPCDKEGKVAGRTCVITPG